MTIQQMKTDPMRRKDVKQPAPSRTRQMIDRIIMMPRVARIILVGVFALAVTLVLTPLIDIIYADNFFSQETLIVPALISAGCGAVMYLFGWWLIVGTVGEHPVPRPIILWYCLVGVFAVVMVIFLVIRGINLVTYFT
jgi:hypothetical protein